MPSDFIKVIEQIIREQRPDVDIRSFTAVHDLLIKPHALLMEPLSQDIDQLKAAQSLLSTTLSDADLDSIMANLFLSRRTGNNATGIARVFFSTPLTVTFSDTDIFVASNGSTFVPQKQVSFPASLVRLNTDGPLYFVDVPVVAQDAGDKARIPAHSLSVIQGTSTNFVRVDNPFPFSGGVNRETNSEFTARGSNAITIRDLVSGKGILTRLQETFAFIDRIFVAGFGDPEQNRDIVDGIHVGGHGDARIKPTSLLAEEVKITAPDANGNFILSNGIGAPGDAKRPVVFLDSMRLLGPGPAFVPIGSPRTREETTLVPLKGIVTAGTYETPSSTINATLNQIIMVAVEVVSDSEKYIVASRLDIQGAVQTPFTRISAASATLANPKVAVNPSNNRAYVFWGDGGTLNLKVLDTSTVGFPVVKDTFALVAGTAQILGRMDIAFSTDGHVHLAFAQRTTDQNLVTQDSVWYARVDPLGNIPGLNIPKQVVFDLPGDNTEPSINVQGVSGSLVATIVFSSKRGTFANLYAIQLDNTGAVTTLSPVQLTAAFEWNDQPTASQGPGEAIHVLFRENFNSVAYLRIQKTGLSISVPLTRTLTRTIPIDDLHASLNPYGFLYGYWVEFAGDFDDVFSVKIDPKGNQIGPVHDLTNTPYFSSSPTLTSDTSGALHLTWTDGIKGSDKPFYIKRLPQEWRLIVADSKLRYSTKENLAVAVELPAANGVALDIRWADLLPQVQDFVDSSSERTIVADLLIRHQIPATATCAVKFGPRGGTLTESAAQTAIEDFFTNFQGTEIEVSAITALLHEAGAKSVSPFDVTIEVDNDDGTILVLNSNDSISLPRGLFLTPVGVTATFK